MQVVTKNNLSNFTEKLLRNDKAVQDEVAELTKGIEYTDSEDAFYLTDGQGNIIFKADKDGVKGVGLGESGGGGVSATSPYSGKKMISIGDSLSAHDKWQKWVAEWTGMTFDNNENINGKDGHKPMAKGGTAVFPNSEDSIYMRALDAQYYSPDVIFLNAGQNDINHICGESDVNNSAIGTIDDTPYRLQKIYTEATDDEKATYTSWYQGRPTMYSYFQGLLENLLEQNPTATIFICTGMQMYQPDNKKLVGRQIVAEAWQKIAVKYRMPLINVWDEAGVNDFNAASYYPNAGNVHPTDFGYKRFAEVVYRTL